MKTTKLNFAFAAAFIITALLLTGFGWSGWIKDAARKDTPLPAQEIVNVNGERVNGTAEFYFRLPNDSRTWHVINIYNPANPESINNSVYTFSGDSVTVINEIAGLPENEIWEPYISGLIFKNN